MTFIRNAIILNIKGIFWMHSIYIPKHVKIDENTSLVYLHSKMYANQTIHL